MRTLLALILNSKSYLFVSVVFVCLFHSVTVHAKTRAAQLQMLNKITAEVTKQDAVLGAPIEYGTLEITARSCFVPSKKTQSENDADSTIAPEDTAALLDIKDFPPGEPSIHVFSGWMFVSSPALSAIEHPVYDVRVLGCTEK